MSKSGITFEVAKGRKSGAAEGQAVASEALRSPEAQKALDLLQSRLLVRDATSGQMEGLDIEQVETYDRGLDPRYAKVFDSKERRPGTLFVIKFRGTALVNVVVDPEKRSVVYIKAVSSVNGDSASPASNLKRLLGDDFVEKLDGASLDNPTETGIELAPKGPGSGILDIMAKMRGQTGDTTRDEHVILKR